MHAEQNLNNSRLGERDALTQVGVSVIRVEKWAMTQWVRSRLFVAG